MKGTVVAALCAATMVTGCSAIEGVLGGSKPEETPTDKPASGSPGAPSALTTESNAREILYRYNTLRTVALLADNTRLDNGEADSLLETHRAELKILKRQGRKPGKTSATFTVMTPKVSGYPKWIAGVTHDEGNKDRRQMVIIVADKPGDRRPLHAVLSVDLSQPAYQRMQSKADMKDVKEGDVPADDDASAEVTPKEIPAVHAAAVQNPKGREAARFDATPEFRATGQRIATLRKYFTSGGWQGTSKVSGWSYPTYAMKMSNGGALMWYGVDVKHNYRNAGGGSPRKGLVGGQWGNVFPGLIGKAAVKQQLTGVERTEFMAYVPPKGQGKMIILGSRWSPVKASGA